MKAEKNNATCSICGKGYYLCQSCKNKMKLNPWKIHTDTSEHFKVFQIVRGYTIGLYDKSEARERLENVDLSDSDTFLPEIRFVINAIMSEENVSEVEQKSDDIDTNITDRKIRKPRNTKK